MSDHQDHPRDDDDRAELAAEAVASVVVVVILFGTVAFLTLTGVGKAMIGGALAAGGARILRGSFGDQS